MVRGPPRQLGRAFAQSPRRFCLAARTANKVEDPEAKPRRTARRDMVAEVKPLFKFLWPESENNSHDKNYDGPSGNEKTLISWDPSMGTFRRLTRRRSPVQRRRAQTRGLGPYREARV